MKRKRIILSFQSNLENDKYPITNLAIGDWIVIDKTGVSSVNGNSYQIVGKDTDSFQIKVPSNIREAFKSIISSGSSEDATITCLKPSLSFQGEDKDGKHIWHISKCQH